jgi:type IV pilus assembly protein PilW
MITLCPRRQRGFSLVELMVSVVIGMLALLFATRLVVSGETNKDAALGGSDQMQNGMLAMFSLSGDAATAGWGLNDPYVAGCRAVFADTRGYQLLSTQINGATVQPLAGVVIQSNGAAPDQISFNSGSSQTGVGSLKIISTYSAGNVVTVDSPQPYGFNDQDVLVVAANDDGVSPCTVTQMSGFSPGAGNGNQMQLNTGANYRFSPQAGMATGYTANASYVYNLGQPDLLHFHTWSVNNGFLMLRATDLGGAAANAVAVTDNIVSIKAEYGFDTRVVGYYDPSPPGNSTQTVIYKNGVAIVPDVSGMQVTQWSPVMINADTSAASPGTGDLGDFQRIVAVRIAVVARSKTAEKPNSAGVCSATTELPVVFDSSAPAGVAAVPITVNVAVPGDTVNWQCYRYRVFETIVPVINSQYRP